MALAAGAPNRCGQAISMINGVQYWTAADHKAISSRILKGGIHTVNGHRTVVLAALSTLSAVVLIACSSTSSNSGSAGYNAAVDSVVNPSMHKGGTLTYGMSSAPDSTDPGNTYTGFVWNFSHLYTVPLMTFKSCPGACGLQLVPDLATGPGAVSANGLAWIYHIQPDVKFENGTVVTSADVKYAIERTFDKSVLPNGPSYFQELLAPQSPPYPGPYKDKTPGHMGLKSVTTPNPTTIVFHLARPFADFNYVVSLPQTAPVLPSADLGKNGGINYQLHPMSTGPYKFLSYQLNKQLILVPNPYWNPVTDPNAKQLASKIVVTMNMNADDIDNRLMANDLDVDLLGGGVQVAARARILSSAVLKSEADDPITGSTWLAFINTRVAPLNNVACRRAIEYAANKITLQDAFGGPAAGGAIASTVAPPNTVGWKPFDLYESTTKPSGDLVKAKQELAACGHAKGFSTNIAYASDRPKQQAAALALQAALAQAGITAGLNGYPLATYFADFAGVPNYAHLHDLGISFAPVGADWPDGYGFFYSLVDGHAILPAGNSNIAELNDPIVNGLLAKMATTDNAAIRNSYTSRIDMQVMNDAAILPVVYAKSLLYRNPNLTNVMVEPYYGEYNYAVLGLK
jgi:peptide/nickel transport system substrate-binding protein